MKDDEVLSVRRREWKQRNRETSDLFKRETKKLRCKNNEILKEILQVKSKWECSIMEFRRNSMCAAIICVPMVLIWVFFFLVGFDFIFFRN